MKAPAFWAHDGLLSRAMIPLSWVWQAETTRRLRSGKRERLAVPVICAGNLTVGGTGKTPLAIALMQMLQARGIAGHFVSRGYGGNQAGPLRVDPIRHSAAQVGDEPLLLAAFAPAWIGRDRTAAAQAAVAAGAQAIVLDDGFQNPALHHDLAVIAVDAETSFGNGRIVPAGPLREPVTEGLARAGLVVTIGDETAQTRFRAENPGLNTVAAELKPLPTGMDWKGQKVLAFAGIGRPAKFFATLRTLGAKVVATREFGDHEPYSTAILKRLESEAIALTATMVTTEKDAVRLPEAFRMKVTTLPVRLQFSHPQALEQVLYRLFQRTPAR
jgi:tetraacyldisaccharide 4'-kinase